MMRLVRRVKTHRVNRSGEEVDLGNVNVRGTKKRTPSGRKRTPRSKEVDLPTKLTPKEKEELITKAYENASTTKVAEDSWSFLPPIKTQQAKISRRRQVKGFVMHAICKGPRGLIAEFRKMKRTNDLTKMKEFVAQISTGRNRYKDVGCLDNNRVVLTIGPCPYIHANYVSTPENPKKFICTQAPLPGTCADFWYMVVQESTEIIVMLCNFIEQNSKKCAVYFPTQRGAPMTFDDVSVFFKSQEQYVFPFETKSKLEVTFLDVSIPGFPLHSCTHYHWMDWPDRGVPSADLAPLHLLNTFEKTKSPIIIHCSAGIGRTGSIVLLQHAMEVLRKGETLEEISVYLLELRKQRNNSIQVSVQDGWIVAAKTTQSITTDTDQQFLFVHQVLLTFFRRSGLIPESLYPLLDVFTTEYNSATSGF